MIFYGSIPDVDGGPRLVEVAVDPDFGMLGASLVACILGTLLMMENGSFGTGVERLYYVLAGLAAAYAHLGRSSMNLAERDGRMR